MSTILSLGTITIGMWMPGTAAVPGSEQKLTASPMVKDAKFGYCVDVSGDRAIVSPYHGSQQADPFISILERSHSTAPWSQVETIQLTDYDDVQYSYSVAISGDTAVIGDLWFGSAHTGVVYVHERDAGGPGQWGQAAVLWSVGVYSDEFFGKSVDIAGDRIVVGAPGNDDAGQNFGAAYVFERDAGGPGQWGQVGQLLPSDGSEHEKFGDSVAIDGDLVVVGHAKVEAAYVYERDAGGPQNWGEVAVITALDAAAGDSFGGHVAISGDTIAVGAAFEDGPGNHSGAAYLFQRDQGGPDAWDQVAKVEASDATFGDIFGKAVTLDGDRLAVGAPSAEGESTWESGAVYLYDRNEGGPNAWGETSKIVAGDPANGDRFGWSVALDSESLLVGAMRVNGTFSDVGAVYAYSLCSSTPGTETLRAGEPANPLAFLPGVTSAPSIGVTWDPVIDHTTFLPAAVVDVVFVSTGSFNASLPPLGTLLCDLTAPYFVFTAAPGTPFAIPIPSNCSLSSVALYAQGLSSDGTTHLFTNAIDVTIGA